MQPATKLLLELSRSPDGRFEGTLELVDGPGRFTFSGTLELLTALEDATADVSSEGAGGRRDG